MLPDFRDDKMWKYVNYKILYELLNYQAMDINLDISGHTQKVVLLFCLCLMQPILLSSRHNAKKHSFLLL